MKIKIIALFILCSLFVNNAFSQSGEGNALRVNIKKNKPVIVWQSHLSNSNSVNALTTRVIAEIKCKDIIKSVELIINGAQQRGFKNIKSGNGYLVKIDKTITLKEGQNAIYIVAKTARESVSSKTKTIIAHKPANKPVISWISPTNIQTMQKTASVNIKACVKSDIPVKSLDVYINGSLMRGYIVVESTNVGCAAVVDKKVKLKKGENSIYIVAKNKSGSTTSETIFVTYGSAIKDQKRIALIIGNSEYENVGSLKNPKNDATDMAAALKRLNFDVELLSDADFEKLGMAVDRFGTRVKNADISFFYYAGHGVQVKGNNYLVPVSADIKDENQVRFQCVDANQVLAYMESGESRVNIIVMDACRNNPFERSWRSIGGGRGLASMDAPVGSIVAYATEPGNTAADGTGENGMYTSALLEYIENPELSLLEIFMKVRVKVLSDSKKQQTPWESSSLTENVYLLK